MTPPCALGTDVPTVHEMVGPGAVVVAGFVGALVVVDEDVGASVLVDVDVVGIDGLRGVDQSYPFHGKFPLGPLQLSVLQHLISVQVLTSITNPALHAVVSLSAHDAAMVPVGVTVVLTKAVKHCVLHVININVGAAEPVGIFPCASGSATPMTHCKACVDCINVIMKNAAINEIMIGSEGESVWIDRW